MSRRTSHLIVLFFILFSLAGCASHRGSAPVSDRGAGKATSSGDKWATVRKGDTLFSISFAHGRSHLAVAKLNRIKPPYTIYPGQRIKVTGKAPRTTSKKKNYKMTGSPAHFHIRMAITIASTLSQPSHSTYSRTCYSRRLTPHRSSPATMKKRETRPMSEAMANTGNNRDMVPAAMVNTL